MSPPVDMGPVGPSDEGEDLLAAEYALGVLDAAERRAAEARMDADPAFAREVEAWSLRLAPITSELPGATAPDGVWRLIERRLAEARAETDRPAALGATRADGADVVAFGLRRSLVAWRRAALAFCALAAALVAALIWPRPAPAPTPVAAVQAPAALPVAPTPPAMTARLAGKAGGAAFIVVLEPARASVLVAPASVAVRPARAPELWLLPTGGKPVALGVVSFTRAVRLRTAAGLGGSDRLTLAVSIEPPGGSPTGQPTGPVIATGALQPL